MTTTYRRSLCFAMMAALLVTATLRGQGPTVQTVAQGSRGQGAGTIPGQQPTPSQPAPAAPRTGNPNAQRGPIPADLTEYRIGPEDLIDISVWKNTDLSRTVAVRPDGRISLPLLNDITVANMTPTQLRDVIAQGYAKYLPEPEVSVIIREIHSIKVSVVGLVKTPGRYELKSQATVLEALAMAGGLTEFAKGDRIVVFRRGPNGTTQLPFNYKKILQDWDVQENFLLQPGDIIVVG